MTAPPQPSDPSKASMSDWDVLRWLAESAGNSVITIPSDQVERFRALVSGTCVPVNLDLLRRVVAGHALALDSARKEGERAAVETPALDKALGLHQHVAVIYVVDGYEATLEQEAGGRVVGGFGATVGDAIAALECSLAFPEAAGRRE